MADHVDWRSRCLEREQRLAELAMWARKMGLPTSLVGNRVRKLLDLETHPFARLEARIERAVGLLEKAGQPGYVLDVDGVIAVLREGLHG